MNGRALSPAVGTLVARSRRPAWATLAATARWQAAGIALTPPGNTGTDTASAVAATTPPTGPGQIAAPKPPPSRSAVDLAAPAQRETRPVPTARPARHEAPRIPPAPVSAAVPVIPSWVAAPVSGAPSRQAASKPLTERARRPALSAAPPVGAASPVANPYPLADQTHQPASSAAQPAPAEAAPPAAVPDRAPSSPEAPFRARAEPAHPPVTIGEIHVHVAEPAPSTADPLALLAPYRQGLTARRGGAR